VMSRPKFLRTVMPPAVISAIRERQREYDRNPERYEYRQRLMEEARYLEMQQEAWRRLEEEEAARLKQEIELKLAQDEEAAAEYEEMEELKNTPGR